MRHAAVAALLAWAALGAASLAIERAVAPANHVTRLLWRAHVAVVSAGEANPFGHPAQLTLDHYAQWGVRLYGTDRDGAVQALTDGRSLSVHAYAEKLPPILEPH